MSRRDEPHADAQAAQGVLQGALDPDRLRRPDEDRSRGWYAGPSLPDDLRLRAEELASRDANHPKLVADAQELASEIERWLATTAPDGTHYSTSDESVAVALALRNLRRVPPPPSHRGRARWLPGDGI